MRCMRAMPRYVLAAAMLLACATAPVAQAAEDSWDHTVALYLWGAGLDGSVQIGPVPAEVDASFGDILENLELATMLAWRAERGPIAITVDAMFVGLGGDGDGPLGTRFDLDVDQFIVGADLAMKLDAGFAVLGGLRYVSLDNGLQIRGPGGAVADLSRKEDWIDPYVGASGTWPLGEKWSVTARGDVGGFGVGSDLAWNAVLRFEWKFSERATLTFGYRALDIDFEEGSGIDLFAYDMLQSGPVAGLLWHF